MFWFKLRNNAAFFFEQHKKKCILIFLTVILAVVSIIFGPSLFSIVRDNINERIAIRRFHNMPREDMIYDFEYLMAVLEENWPFFNLSISANNVDVRLLADNTRNMLNDTNVEINDPFDFMDLIQEYFFAPINQLGHLRQFRCDELFFSEKEIMLWLREQGAIDRHTDYINKLNNKPEVILFYSQLREAERGTPLTPRPPGPVIEFEILEEGRIAYMGVNRMIFWWEDTVHRQDRRKWNYEKLMYDFTRDIEGFDHLIMDLRGNPGGNSIFFDMFVMPHLINEIVHFNAYVHFMGGKYAGLARETFDIRSIFPVEQQAEIDDILFAMREAYLTGSLPYLDTEQDLVYVFYSNHQNWPGRYYYFHGLSLSAREENLFNGKIWVLTDGYTASAAESVVAALKYNNIATVVGESTRGILGSAYDPAAIKFSLPNTGVLVRIDVGYYTDFYGRPLQGYGIQPNYPNRPGMDALETVLAMIENGIKD